MFKPLPLFLALRYIGAGQRTRFISFVSLTAIVGLTLGVAVLIVVLSIMNGFGAELRERILGTIPHAVVSPAEPLQDWSPLVAELTKAEEVSAAAPLVRIDGMLSYYGELAGVRAYGIDPTEEMAVSKIGSHLLDDLQFDGLSVLEPGAYRIIVGKALANRLGLTLGDKVTLVLPELRVTPAGMMPRYRRFTIAGWFEVGADLDGYLAYIHWQDAAKLQRHAGRVSGVRVLFDDMFVARDWLSENIPGIDDSLTFVDWTQTHGTLFQAVKIEKRMVTLLLLLIVAVAAFNMVSSLVMLVSEKQADIAILRTLGASPAQIRQLFLLQGGIITLVGVGVGALSGIWLAGTIGEMFTWLEELLGVRFFAAYFVDYLPSVFLWEDVGFVVSFAVMLSLCATVLPANKAAKTEPVAALRYE